MSRPTAKQIAELKQAAKQLLRTCERTTFLAPSLDRVRAALEAFEKPMPVTVNAEQELYVIPAGHGYSCLGYDVCLVRHKAVTAWLRSEGLDADDFRRKHGAPSARTKPTGPSLTGPTHTASAPASVARPN